MQLRLLEGVVSGLRQEVSLLEHKLLLSDHARSSALAERDWWTGARQHFSLELQVGEGQGGSGGVVLWWEEELWSKQSYTVGFPPVVHEGGGCLCAA